MIVVSGVSEGGEEGSSGGGEYGEQCEDKK